MMGLSAGSGLRRGTGDWTATATGTGLEEVCEAKDAKDWTVMEARDPGF
jgi:hypothetical protein